MKLKSIIEIDYINNSAILLSHITKVRKFHPQWGDEKLMRPKHPLITLAGYEQGYP